MNIKQSVINTFDRVGIDYKGLQDLTGTVVVTNRFGGGSCETTPFISELISWVYRTSNAYEGGDTSINVSDFDRVRYFILEQDKDAYYACID